MSCLLCDIGGTHIRFGLSRDGTGIDHIAKLKVAQFSSFTAAVQSYLSAQNETACDKMVLSMAAQFHDGAYRFANDNAWVIEPAHVTQDLNLNDLIILNDFEANARGIATITDDEILCLHTGQGILDKTARRMVIGVGTGLGLAYINPDNSIQPSFGGHMVAVTPTPEDRALFEFIHADENPPRAWIYEDVLSGRGLYNVYRFLCAQNHLDVAYGDTAQMLKHADQLLVIQTLKIFARFLGLFAHQAAMFGHGFAGVYLTGGILDRLVPYDYFDVTAFRGGLVHANVAVVRDACENLPIAWVKDEFISLKGLVGLCATPI
jgi:glucokinase